MNKKLRFLIFGVCLVLFFVLIFLVRTVDVAAIGPVQTEIGLSSINESVHNLFGENMIWYKITELFGILALLVVGIFALIGLIQLIRRKSFFKVDKEILTLGGLYVVVLGLYALFEVVIVDYRPVLESGSEFPEASFPSSHTMLICVIMGSTIMVLSKYIKNKKLCAAMKIVCAMIMIVTVVGRLICGVHWFTDILGGVLISISLLSLFSGILSCLSEKE